MGLRKLHSLTQQGTYILRVDLEDWSDKKLWAEYHVSLEGPSEHYALRLSSLSGNLANAMSTSTGVSFSTKDRNNVDQRYSDCTRNHTGKLLMMMHKGPILYLFHHRSNNLC